MSKSKYEHSAKRYARLMEPYITLNEHFKAWGPAPAVLPPSRVGIDNMRTEEKGMPLPRKRRKRSRERGKARRAEGTALFENTGATYRAIPSVTQEAHNDVNPLQGVDTKGVIDG